MLNICVLSRYLSPVVEICQMFVRVVPLSHPRSKDLLYVKCLCVVSLSQPNRRDLLDVKCLCALSRYPSPVVEICYMLKV